MGFLQRRYASRYILDLKVANITSQFTLGSLVICFIFSTWLDFCYLTLGSDLVQLAFPWLFTRTWVLHFFSQGVRYRTQGLAPLTYILSFCCVCYNFSSTDKDAENQKLQVLPKVTKPISGAASVLLSPEPLLFLLQQAVPLFLARLLLLVYPASELYYQLSMFHVSLYQGTSVFFSSERAIMNSSPLAYA